MILVVQLGTVDYATGLRLQQQLVALRKEETIGDVLLLLEHKPVITLGRNAKTSNVTASPELLSQRGVELFECDRGGDVTFHGPGQIVAYPIFDLRGFARSVTNTDSLSSRAEENDSLANRSQKSRDLGSTRRHLGAVDFVRCLEEVLMRTCADFAIPTKRVKGLTGVWTSDSDLKGRDFSRAVADPGVLSSRAEEDDSLANRPLKSRDLLSTETSIGEGGPNYSDTEIGAANNGFLNYAGQSTSGSSSSARNDKHESTEAKLAAIGVHISRFVTSHGFALNVNTDLSYFNLIIPCGITAKPVTSMQRELGRELDLNAVAESISRNFGAVFQSQMLWVDTLDALLGRSIGVPVNPPEELRQIQADDTYRT